MSWSTTKPSLPSGASWSTVQYGSQNSENNYYYFRAGASIARGKNNTVYVWVRMQVYGKTYGVTGEISLNARVGGAVSESKSSKYVCTGGFGAFSTAKNVYYTGTAAPGQTIWADVMWNSANSGNVSMTVPAYVTTFSISFDPNSEDAVGTMTSQTKKYGSTVTLTPNAYDLRGYAFDHWNTAANDSGTSYADKASYSANANATLYAQWVRTNIPAFINVNGEIHQVDQAYMNIGGEIKECDVFVNVGGTVYAII